VPTTRLISDPVLSTTRESGFSGQRKAVAGTAIIVALLTAISTVAMLVCASPELWWDEADYVS